MNLFKKKSREEAIAERLNYLKQRRKTLRETGEELELARKEARVEKTLASRRAEIRRLQPVRNSSNPVVRGLQVIGERAGPAIVNASKNFVRRAPDISREFERMNPSPSFGGGSPPGFKKQCKYCGYQLKGNACYKCGRYN